MISEKTIERVRDLNIEDVLKPYVTLQKKGSSLMGICPFHFEKTGSFSVSPSKNLYHCFSCNRGGDAIHFIMEKENLSFVEAIEFLAKNHNIPLEKTETEKSVEERELYKHKESLLVTLEQVNKFYIENLRLGIDIETDNAKRYIFGRWSEDFCYKNGVGYAPSDPSKFLTYIKEKALNINNLIELGILKKSEKGQNLYPLFRERATIPIKDKWGRLIGFTCRYVGEKPGVNKYINSSNSIIYTKGKSIFGIDKASRCKDSDYVIIVEGASDVLRMQSVGFYNTVASLGTFWTELQFEQLKRFTDSICFIPDSDPPEGRNYGPGFKAVINNGSNAIKKGFNVTVRELPFTEIELTEDEIAEFFPQKLEIPENVPRIKPGKNDADNHIKCKEDYLNLIEKHFILWLAEKRFCNVSSFAEERKCIREIADLLRYITDQLIFDQCIDNLSKIHGKAKVWRDAVIIARVESRKNKEALNSMDERQKDIELLRQFNLFIRDNCYYTTSTDEDEPVRISNFIMEPLFHIEDDINATRLFRLTNIYGETKVIELRESELCSLSVFQQRVGSLGNFVWPAKIDKLNRVKEYLYSKTRSAERIRKLGWNNENEFFAFGNGVYKDNQFHEVDYLGMVALNTGKEYYLPALSKIYIGNPEIFQFERLMIHRNRSGIKIKEFAERLIEVFGENARVAMCYLFSSIFRDIIYQRTRHFPILNLFGEKGTGKTTLATCLQSFFLHGIDPPNLGVTSVPSMNDRISQSVNTLVIFDEYKNDLDFRKISFLKGIWGGGGQTKKNTATDGMAAQTLVSTGVVLCGQDKPTQDMALFTRVIFLAFSKTNFNSYERGLFDELVMLCDLGLTHLTLELLCHRSLFEKNFKGTYNLVKHELSERLKDKEIHDRVFGNWIIPLATFRTLETVLELPFNYGELFETAVKGILNQNELTQESSELADFWNVLQGMQTSGKCIEGSHFKIRYLKAFKPLGMKDDIEFHTSRPILYLNSAAVSTLFNNRTNNITTNRSNWSTILSYLKSHDSYLGLKQDRFIILLPNGTPDYYYENENGTQIRKQKVIRPKAMCFDYLKLKERFSIDLETEEITDKDIDIP